MRVALYALTALCGFVPAARAASPKPGVFDPAFGSGGTVISPLVAGVGTSYSISGAAVGSGGVILVLGTNETPGGPLNFVVDAFRPDGQPDASFADAGVLQGPAGTVGNSIAVASDGEIFLSAGLDDDNEVLALNADGTPVTSFGADGAVQIGDSQPPPFVDGSGLYLQPDGKILFTGQTPGVHYGFVERLNASGSVDTTFGRDGRALLGRPDGLTINPPLAQNRDGDLTVAGGYPGDLIRLLPDGKHDPSFGHHGQIYLRALVITALALQPNAKIVVADEARSPTGIMSRFNSNGSLDTSFGDQGHIASEPGHAGYPAALAVQPNGAIVYADGAKVVRLQRNGALDLGFGQDGVTKLPRETQSPTQDCVHNVCGPPFRSTVKLVLLANGEILDAGAIEEYDASTGTEGYDVLLGRLVGGGAN